MTRIAVLSDIHAFRPAAGRDRFLGGDPSWARTIPDRFEEERGPFQALGRTIEHENLKADLVFCCGDLGDKADTEGIRHSWSWLETIRRRLDAELVIATTGNHDVDSRNTSGRDDPMHCTRVLQPPFPIDVPATRSEYWDKNVALYSSGDVDVLIVNTSAEHSTEEMAQRGRLTEETLRVIQDCVDQAKSEKRIALVHHHPYRHDAIDWRDNSELEGGPEFLRILEDDGDWLVIHGHRHYPNLVYAAGGGRSPVILAAGSFSAMLYPELQSRVRNQFHLVNLEAPGNVPGTSGIIGSVRSWEYTPSTGWARPISQEGIPDGSGFGFRGAVDDVAERVAAYVKASPERYVVFEDVISANPELRYLIPRDRRQVIERLAAHGVSVSPTVNNYSVPSNEIFLKDVLT
ncbi:metallophosphoesterase family protein [Mycolicibacterium neoaurum]|uniref:metallophosphoesterase family protein n=1 Tax=Mycolicibacterium neoaurum TaxID=1795 RepID=UPI0009DFA602|nr:metallophosphoesterase [Mycolicibacterium neoaurum]